MNVRGNHPASTDQPSNIATILSAVLTFNKYNVHDRKIPQTSVEQAELALEAGAIPSPSAKILYKQLGIYHAYHTRNREKALHYLEKYLQATEEGSLEHADTLVLIGFAHTIYPSYQDDRLHREA